MTKEVKAKVKAKVKRNRGKIMYHISLFSLVFVVIWLVSHYGFHKEFVKLKENIPMPEGFFARQMVNIIVLLLILVVLYVVRIYEIINNIIGGIFSDPEEKKRYRKSKIAVWVIISGLLYFFAVPKVLSLTNSIFSLIINAYRMVIYLLPTFVISGVVYFAILFGVRHWKQQKKQEEEALDLDKNRENEMDDLDIKKMGDEKGDMKDEKSIENGESKIENSKLEDETITIAETRKMSNGEGNEYDGEEKINNVETKDFSSQNTEGSVESEEGSEKLEEEKGNK